VQVDDVGQQGLQGGQALADIGLALALPRGRLGNKEVGGRKHRLRMRVSSMPCMGLISDLLWHIYRSYRIQSRSLAHLYDLCLVLPSPALLMLLQGDGRGALQAVQLTDGEGALVVGGEARRCVLIACPAGPSRGDHKGLMGPGSSAPDGK